MTFILSHSKLFSITYSPQFRVIHPHETDRPIPECFQNLPPFQNPIQTEQVLGESRGILVAMLQFFQQRQFAGKGQVGVLSPPRIFLDGISLFGYLPG